MFSYKITCPIETKPGGAVQVVIRDKVYVFLTRLDSLHRKKRPQCEPNVYPDVEYMSQLRVPLSQF
jgi:hypothetical protein